ncbi:MAG: acyl-CoA thioesterase [Gammaproteobacteria bacterium]|nr:acyl-CoA thioesterase [Gammaproteobacteria bacterium]
MTFEQFQKDFPVIVPISVAWGEMDAFQHVNNVVYLRYFETARIAYMEQIGMNTDLSKAKQGSNPIGPILADSYCRYRRPVTYPDTLHIGCRISELQEFGFVMEYQAFSEQQQTIATIGHSRIVMIDYFTGQKSALPRDLIAQIKEQQSDLL